MEHIVVGIDGSEGSERALRWAVGEAARRGAAVDAVLVRGEDLSDGATGAERRAAAVARESAEATADGQIDAAVGADHVVRVDRSTRTGQPAAALLEAAAVGGALMLVVGSRGRGGFAGLLLGSVSTQCLTHAEVPTVVVPSDWVAGGVGAARRTVVGVDGSEGSREALRWAVADAALDGRPVEVVRAWQQPSSGAYTYATPMFDWAPIEAAERAGLDDEVASVDCSPLQGPPERTLVSGPAAPSILDAADGADRIVVGSRGLGSVKGWLLGSVGRRLAHHADCPVVVVPDPSGHSS